MKIDLIRDDIVKTEGFEVAQMQFDMSKTAKLFHMLSSTLYSDKMGSVVRELSSNAHDSHLEASKLDIPFQLTSPTFENPSFKIRDFGIGLTAEEAIDTILCYLGSTKDQSDDFIGGYGIGSKSPFAYAMSYEVKVFKDNQFAHFHCWKNEQGIPDRALIDSGYTDEPNGVEMIMPVESKDIPMFRQTLTNYMNWTNYNVILDGLRKPREPIAEKEYPQFTVKVYRNGTGQRRLVYGGMSYNISECVDDRYDYASDWSKLSNMLRVGFDIAWVIDQPNLVNFNMNREVLEQTQKSTMFIRAMLKNFLATAEARNENTKKLNERWSKTVSDCSNLLELETIIQDISKEISGQNNDTTFDSIFLIKDLELSYRFKSLQNTIQARGVFRLPNFSIDLLPIEDQLRIAWSPRAKPSATDRRAFARLTANEFFVYVKAKTKSDCIKILEESVDFAGIDLSKFTIEKVDITKNIRAISTGVKSDNPFVYCTTRKRRLPFSESTVYVNSNPEVSLTPIQNEYAKFHNTTFLTPSKSTLENLDVIEFSEFEDIVEKWKTKIQETYLPTVLMNKLDDFFINFWDEQDKDVYKELKRRHSNVNCSYLTKNFERLICKYRNKDYIAETKKMLREEFKRQKERKTIKKFVDLKALVYNKDHPLCVIIEEYMERNNLGV